MPEYIYIVTMFEELPPASEVTRSTLYTREDVPSYEIAGYYTSFEKATKDLESNYMSVDDKSYKFGLIERCTSNTFYGYNNFQEWYAFDEKERRFYPIEFYSYLIQYIVL